MQDKNTDPPNCDLCMTELEEDSGDVMCSLGSLPCNLCIWCFSSLTEMVIELNGFNDIAMLEERIRSLKDE